MKKWKLIMISFISFMLVGITFPNVGFADQDLDSIYQEFHRAYEKKTPQKLHLAQSGHDQASIHNRQILIKTFPDAMFAADSYDVTAMDGYDYLKAQDIYVVHVPKEVSYSKKVVELNRIHSVIYAEPDYVITNTGTAHRTQNGLYNKQWYLDKIDLKKAWEITRGSGDVTIAVIDSGVNSAHPDLQGRVLEGFDFLSRKSAGNRDYFGHGTHVAGIIAANENDIGVTGIDQEAMILPVKAMGENGTGSIADEIDSIYYAIEHDADIINMSYVTETESKLEKEALWEAHDAGVVLVASAGNYSSEASMFPAAYPQVMNVSSTTADDRLADFSNFGTGIDIAAPGESILSTSMDGGYMLDDGTSFSAPIVSGVAGLVKSIHPEWSPNEIRFALENSAKTLKGLEWDNHFGYGRINAYRAVTNELPNLEGNAANTSESAREAKSGERINEKMDLPMDVDWYRFSVPKNTEVTIDLTNKSSHIDLVGKLYKARDDEYNEMNVVDDYAMGEDEQLIKNLSKGNYYFAVSDYHGRWSKEHYYVQINYDEKAVQQKPYPDVTSYQEEINYLSTVNIINGFPDGLFRPDFDIKRIQALSMILREKGVDIDNYEAPNPHFKDVKPGDVGYKEVAVAVDLGIVTGKGDNTFDLWGSLTRSQMASMMVGTYGYTGVSEVTFTDVGKMHWAYEPIQALVANGIAKGYPNNTFEPYTPLSRQHFALLMYRKIMLDE